MSCLAAANARVIGVIVRRRGEDNWSCVAKWDVGAKRVDIGAWTTMRLLERRCRLSACGEFMMYVAQGPESSPFPTISGGAVAISRLPWLAALTDARPASVAGGGPTKHALPPLQQQMLWKLFDDVPAWYFRVEDWPSHLGEPWSRLDPHDPLADGLWHDTPPEHRLAAVAPVPDTDHRLIAIAHAERLHANRPGEPRFHLRVSHHGQRRTLSLEIATWVCPDVNGAILIATRDLHLQRVMMNRSGEGWSLDPVQDHDLSNLEPAPGPAPDWATAPLASNRMRGTQ